MMTPVGRLIMVRSIDKQRLVNAMSLVTVPALIGPICGPPLGGFITTYASWHWIFLINVPIGLLGIAMASRFIANVRVERPDPFDFIGFLRERGERRDWRDLMSAQAASLAPVWDNAEDKVWDDV